MSQLQLKPWLSMWMHPRKTVQAVIEYRPNYGFILLSAIVGWPAAIQIAQIYALSESLSLPVILLITVLAAPLLGALGIVIFSGITYWIGKAMGGASSFAEMKCAIAWSNITGIFSVLSYATLIMYFKGGWFSPSWVNIPVDRYMAYIFFCLFIIQIVSIALTIYLLVQSVSQVQKFSVWKSMANLALSCLVLWGVIQFLG